MSGQEAHIENTLWMKAVVMGSIFLLIGVAAYATMGVGMANVRHHEYEEAVHEYEDAKHAYEDAKAANASEDEISQLYDLKTEAHHHEIDAHLSYLTWRTAGITILLMCGTYASFIGLGGFLNSIQPQDDGHDSHDDYGYGGGHEHHGSGSPIVFAFGIMLFLMGFPSFQATLKDMLAGNEAALGDLGMSMVGLMIVVIGVSNWWREDLPFIGNNEQLATSDPFAGQHIRKAGLWIFIMSEIMVFATFFSAYLRMRTEWCTGWQVEAGNCSQVNMLTASDFLRPNGAKLGDIGGQGDFMTLLPGAINTFALIISSYTIVLALKTANTKASEWKASQGFMGKIMPTQKAAIRNYLIATLMLGSLFIVLKLIEWSHLVAEGFTIETQAGSIFYIATGAHGLHVFIGLLVMLYLVFKADTVGFDEKNAQGIEYFGLYWHFVDLAWVVIFPAFYLY
ncbi:MAG: heme-copper oxidase subunit III [Candidatus Poseidonia sp.]|nr:heme-copper oxidase subunit III [Poseidonia sp.]